MFRLFPRLEMQFHTVQKQFHYAYRARKVPRMLCWLVKMVMHLLLKLQEAQKNLPLKKSIEQLTSILPDLEKKVNSYRCNLSCFMGLVMYQ